MGYIHGSAEATKELREAVVASIKKLVDCSSEFASQYKKYSANINDDSINSIVETYNALSKKIEQLMPEIAEVNKRLRTYEEYQILITGSAMDAWQGSTVSSKNNAIIASASTISGFANKVDFGNLDSRTSRDIAMAISDTKQMFPELNIGFVGSAQARNKAIEADLRNEYLAVYRRHYPNATDNELLPIVNQHVEEDMAALHIGGDTIAQSLYVSLANSIASSVFSQYNGITINEQYGSDYGFFQKTKQQNVAVGWKPIKCDTPKATVDHELGHQIAKLVNAHNDSSINALYDEFSCIGAQKQTETLSGYAATNIHEFIAESWSEYRNNPNCREYAKKVSERIIELYNTRNNSNM